MREVFPRRPAGEPSVFIRVHLWFLFRGSLGALRAVVNSTGSATRRFTANASNDLTPGCRSRKTAQGPQNVCVLFAFFRGHSGFENGGSLPL